MPTVLLSGVDKSAREAIWKSDGTAAGTDEITELFGTSNKPYGSFAQLGSKAMFEGENSRFLNGLFITDGTKAGTKEIVPAAGATSVGLDPVELTSLGPKVLFNGIDKNDNYDLWVSDGTVAGTAPISGTINIDPRNLIAFDGKVYFASIQRKGLWISSGTPAGTNKIEGTATLVPKEMTLAYGKLYFVDGQTGYLYSTNGTSAGTKKLVYTGDSLDLTFDGKKLFFEAQDSKLHRDLFFTDATGATPHEVPNTTGIFDNLLSPSTGAPLSPELTLFKGKLYFEAQHGKGNFGLWVTDGGQGAREITGIKGTHPQGIFPSTRNPDFNGPNFAVIGNEIVFDGVSPGGEAPDFGQTSLWKTNGSAAGTQKLDIKNAGAKTTLGFDPSNMTTLSLPN